MDNTLPTIENPKSPCCKARILEKELSEPKQVDAIGINWYKLNQPVIHDHVPEPKQHFICSKCDKGLASTIGELYQKLSKKRAK